MIKDLSNLCGGLSDEEAVKQITRSIIPVGQRPRKDLKKHTGSLPPIVTAAKLVGDNQKLPDALVAGMLHLGSTMVFGGGSKTNKTFCLMDLAVSVASGGTWWNLPTKKGRVLYLDFELQAPFFANRLHEIVEAKNTGTDVLDDIDVWSLRGYAADLSEQIDEMLERIKTREYALIIIDPIYKALGNRDENAAGDINSLMNEVDKLAVQSGAAVVIGHHFSKGNQAGKDSMDRISGSGVFGRAPDAIVIITKHELDDVFTVESTLRNFKRVEPFCLEWDYPLMVRNDNHDPSRLRKPGKIQLYTPEQLLEVLGSQEQTVKQWLETTQRKHPMGKRTFMDKKKMLLDDGKVEECSLKRWRAVQNQEQVQSAVNAIASSASSPVQSVVDAAAALT